MPLDDADKARDACGVFAIYTHQAAAPLTYFALYALQHRGQESAGIATAVLPSPSSTKSIPINSFDSSNSTHHDQTHTKSAPTPAPAPAPTSFNTNIATKTVTNTAGPLHLHKGLGLVSHVFNEESMRELPGTSAIGHTRYSTSGATSANNAQPFLIDTDLGPMALAHNGQLTKQSILRQLVLKRGTGLFTSSDSEIITQMLATPNRKHTERKKTEHHEKNRVDNSMEVDIAENDREMNEPFRPTPSGCTCVAVSQTNAARSKKLKGEHGEPINDAQGHEMTQRNATTNQGNMSPPPNKHHEHCHLHKQHESDALESPGLHTGMTTTPRSISLDDVSCKKIDVETELNGAVVVHERSPVLTSPNVQSNRIVALNKWEERLVRFVRDAEGAYALVLLTNNAIYGCRDRFGLRPLCIGFHKPSDGAMSYSLASESCAFGPIGYSYLREVRPGEIIRLDHTGVHSTIAMPTLQKTIKPALCIFEYVYFARPDSLLEDQLVHSVRQRLGAQLALEAPVVDADLVSGVPDSSIAAAIGFSAVSALPFQEVLCKNRYIARTFIQPEQSMRDNSIRLKFNPLEANLRNKSLVLVDDSLVRGSTMRQLIRLLKGAGAREIHVRISSPVLRHPCYMGVAIGTYDEILATTLTTPDDMAKHLGADSLAFLSHEGLSTAVCEGIDIERRRRNGFDIGHCSACFTGQYPLEHDNDQSRIGDW